VGGADLGEDGAEVVLDGLFRDLQLAGYLAVGQAVGHEVEDGPLAWCEVSALVVPPVRLLPAPFPVRIPRVFLLLWRGLGFGEGGCGGAAYGVDGGLSAGGGADLGEDGAEVIFDCLLGNLQAAGYLTVGQPVRNEVQQGIFSCGEISVVVHMLSLIKAAAGMVDPRAGSGQQRRDCGIWA
jgi:hypothetical protein